MSERPFIVGVTGFLFEQYKDYEVQRIEELMDQAIQSTNNVAICSHFIDRGIAKVAYDWAWKKAMPILGVAPETCWEHPCRLVNERILINGDWGADVNVFAQMIDGLLVFGESDHSDAIKEMVEVEGKEIIDLSSELNLISFFPEIGEV